MNTPVVTRFAPSPSGALHLGNIRTALFNWLYARQQGGRFLVRIEDTDQARSDEASVAGVLRDLAWLGLAWDAGPDREDGQGPYRQSARAALYAKAFARLESQGDAYPCYCTALELEVARRTELAAGRAPRYLGTCAALNADERAAKAAAGREASLRFRMPAGAVLAFEDLVRGPQRFLADELGDFVIRRSDGSSSFLFSNAMDDAAMGVTHVFRGEDHVANTPRQRAIMTALGVAPTQYGHLPLLVGSAGAPLSKREGSASLQALVQEGFFPEAILNQLARLGHHYADEAWLDVPALVAGFALTALGRAPARFDRVQLLHWQKEAVHRAESATLERWAKGAVPPQQEAAFVRAVRANLVLPADAAEWGPIVFGELPCASDDMRTLLVSAGVGFFEAALAAISLDEGHVSYSALVGGLKASTGRTGAALFKPLRASLTHRLDGPEMAALLSVMPAGLVRDRFAAARSLAASSL